MGQCSFRGPVKEHRLHHDLDRNPVAIRATMAARTLSYIEDGQLNATAQVLDRIHVAIDSLAAEQEREAG